MVCTLIKYLFARMSLRKDFNKGYGKDNMKQKV